MIAPNTDTVAEETLYNGTDDWVQAAELVSIIVDRGLRDDETIRIAGVGVVAQLLVREWMVPGRIDNPFRPWECSIPEAITRIAEDWFWRPEPLPHIWEIFWLNLTPAGEEIGTRVAERPDRSTDTDDNFELPPREDRDVTDPSLTRDVLLHASEHAISVAEIYDITARTGLTDPDIRRATSIGLIIGNLISARVDVGDPGESGFRPWDLFANQALTRIAQDWYQNDDPTPAPDQGPWFRINDQGQHNLTIPERARAGDESPT